MFNLTSYIQIHTPLCRVCQFPLTPCPPETRSSQTRDQNGLWHQVYKIVWTLSQNNIKEVLPGFWSQLLHLTKY
jgi:Zn-finger protein